ncbi:MAG: hypothetical protein IPK66_19035 [Rhodospirillales bacterium]|nr:hypothetical protein [Rhodospirillales bacterium]
MLKGKSKGDQSTREINAAGGGRFRADEWKGVAIASDYPDVVVPVVCGILLISSIAAMVAWAAR